MEGDQTEYKEGGGTINCQCGRDGGGGHKQITKPNRRTR